jgi:hypothetical protein
MMRDVLWSAFRVLRAPVLLLIALAPAGCTDILGDFDGGVAGGGADSAADGTVMIKDSGRTGDAAGKAVGASCAMDSECHSGSCTDGVCCGSPCHGLCETCNLAGGTPGMCAPVPADTDPDKECVLAPTPDAGPDGGNASDAGAATAATDASSDGAGGDADVSDAAATVDGPSDGAPNIGYNPPDGGVVVHQAQCAGSCNGARACKFPDRTKTCGTQFCNTSSQQASFVCDGTGNCGLDLEACSRYACENGACGSDSTTNCAGPSDCLDDSYCNATTNKCVPKKQNSVGCSLSTECQTGFCSQGVCCNSACDPNINDPNYVPGGTCTANGKVGQCTCPACTTGACQLFYRDSDGDGQGDPGNTRVACAGSPPAGYVANNSDCDDNNMQVFLGQTAYFSTPRSNGSYDYNCDGMSTGTPDVLPGAYCGFCSSNPSCGVTSGTCTATQQTYLSCYVGFCHLPPIGPIQTASVTVGQSSTDAIICGGCFGNATEGFTGTAACGQPASYVYCYSCYGSSTSPGSTSSAQGNSTKAFPCH